MFTELLKVTPWWVWLIVTLGAALVFCLAVVMPTILVAKGTPRGSRERAFVLRLAGGAAALAVANCVLCLRYPSVQGSASALFLLALLGLGPWAVRKQKVIRESEARNRPEPPPPRRA